MSIRILWAAVGLVACKGKSDDTGDSAPPDPYTIDSDSDGLTDGDEADMGTDPENPDSDGDGELDGAEVDGGTNPLYDLSHSYLGGWNVGACPKGPPDAGETGPTGLGTNPDGIDYATYQTGDYAYDWAYSDQNGEIVNYYSFCGHQTMLVFFPSWMLLQPMTYADEIAKMQVLTYTQAKYAAYGFQVIIVNIQDFYGDWPNLDDLQGLSAELMGADPNIPIVALPEEDATLGGTWAHYEHDWAQPTFAHVGPDMKMISVDEDETSPCPFIDGAICEDCNNGVDDDADGSTDCDDSTCVGTLACVD